MHVTFLSPVSAVLGLAVLVPLMAVVLRERRHGRIRERLGVGPVGRWASAPVALALVVAFGLLAAAAAQPVVRVESTVLQRADAEAYVLIDITRSMLASRSPGSTARIERAQDAAVELRRALPDVPFGVASLTNRPLPHLFPTADGEEFERVVRQAVGVNRPPGSKGGLFGVATDFQAIESIGSDNWFSPATTKRLVVLLSDGESDPFAPRHLVRALAKGGVDLIVVRLWDSRDRVWQPDGTAEDGYRPIPSTITRLSDLAGLTTGGHVFGPDDLGDVVRAARTYLGLGPVVPVDAPGHTVSLAPYAVLAACLPLALLVLPGLLPRRASRTARGKIAYSMLRRWRASSRTEGPRSRAARAWSRRSSSGPRSSMGGSSPGSA